LEAIAELSAQQAKEQLIQLMQEEAKADAMVLVKDIMDEAQTTANMEAKKVIIKSIQRVGVEALWKMLSLFLISKMTKLKVASLGEKEEISELLKT
jgi:ribonuclease Y